MEAMQTTPGFTIEGHKKKNETNKKTERAALMAVCEKST
jgi:hypothetical protein